MNNQIIKRDDYLVWIDLEMTGLLVEQDVILEIATIITDNNLSVVATGPHLIISQPEIVLQTMNEWCKKQHGLSGLTKAVLESVITLEQAQEETLEFIKLFCKPNSARLCGNSVWQDRIFLQKYMPLLLNYFHYRLVDVTSIKEVLRRWYPANQYLEFKKTDTHRALTDIQESIDELKHYRKHFFIPLQI
ncbi:MAG: Oligoribonuclease [Candidatus Dependentiae bacterium ADurb.Bin331]|nr:MAG: Oligoribonuclease [Candidatus Dependentiae bacterium ADurb.Bin331]